MERPLAALGFFVFSPSRGSYETLTREWEFAWAKPDPIGSAPVKQFMGSGETTLTIQGGIWPEIQSPATWKIERLANLAKTGRTLAFLLGSGRFLGVWCIESLREDQTLIESGGYPGEIAFEIILSKDTRGLSAWPF